MSVAPTLDSRKSAVRQRLSLSEVIEKHVPLSGSSGVPKRRGKCPFHGSNSASLALFDANRGDGGAFCFGCQWQGDMFDFIRDIRGVSFMDALAELEVQAGIAPGGESSGGTGPIHRERNPARRRAPTFERVEPIDMGRWIWRNAVCDGTAVRRYLRGRGVPEAVLTDERMASLRFVPDCPVSPWKCGADPRSEMVAGAVVALVQAPLLVPCSDAARDPSGSLGSAAGAATAGRPCDARGAPDGYGEMELIWRALGVHVTYLNPEGTGTMVRRKPWARADDPDPMLPKRRMLGPVGGGAVVLGQYVPEASIFVGEGNETVLSAMGLAKVDADAVGIATLSLDNLQGAPRLWKNRTWPLFAIEPDPERSCFTIPGHQGSVTGLVDSDMSPLRGKRDRDSRAFLGENVIEHRGGPLVRRPITGAERARICGELFVKGWRRSGAHIVKAVRAPLGMDFNDVARERAA